MTQGRDNAGASGTPASASSAAAASAAPAGVTGAKASVGSASDTVSRAEYTALESRLAAAEATIAALQSKLAVVEGPASDKAAPTGKPALGKSPSGSSALAPGSAAANAVSPSGPGSAAASGSNASGASSIPSSSASGSVARTPPAPSEASEASIAALTQQVAALSTSVAQLQRLQTQSMVSPMNGHPSHPSHAHQHQQHQGQHQHQGALHQQMRMPPPPPLDTNLGNLPGMAHSGHSAHSVTSPFPQQGFLGGTPGPRTPISRPFSGLMSADDKWGAPGQGPGSRSNAGGNQWNSQGPIIQTNGISGMNSNIGSGAAAPGAGIVVTKWEHLNLKVELLRSISKYGIGPPNKIQARVLPFMLKGSDIIAQAPPTQERIISYVIPALQLCLTLPPPQGPYRGPAVIIITTTVDQATQCHKLVGNVGGPLGVRAALAAGAAGSSGLPNELAAMQRDQIQILIGTPAKVNEVMNMRGGLSGADCRLLILDEVDQLIARNLYENVLNIARILPSPRRSGPGLTPGPTPFSPVVGSPYDGGQQSPFNPQSKTPFPAAQNSRFSTPGPGATPTSPTPPIERQTCLFSNTIPTDVINFSQSLQVRDPVRVLVRREGATNSQESVSSVTPGVNLKHTYVYLTITGSARSEESSESGPGTIGSGRNPGATLSEEATRAKEYKLDMLVKMLDDYPLWQAIIHVGTYAMLEAVLYKLGSRQWETLYLSSDMPPPQRKAVLAQWRMSVPGSGPRFLVCFDVTPKPPDIPWTPLVINFDLPRSVEGYALRAAAAVPQAPRQGQVNHVNGVIVSFVQAAGGDVEMLRSTECAYRFKVSERKEWTWSERCCIRSAEIPTVFHDLFQH